MTHGSCFTGVGGFDLGFERAGIETIWQIEIDPFCQKVLEKHWPNVQRFSDIRECRDLPRVDILSGGFPCQPFSSATRGRGKGTADARFLWPEMCRIAFESHPTWVIAENVAHLKDPVLRQVVSDLEGIRYEVGIIEVPACAFGHNHRRSRLWIIGHAHSYGESRLPQYAEASRMPEYRSDAGRVGEADGIPGGLDRHRLRAVGNAVVPQIAEWLGRAVRDDFLP